MIAGRPGWCSPGLGEVSCRASSLTTWWALAMSRSIGSLVRWSGYLLIGVPALYVASLPFVAYAFFHYWLQQGVVISCYATPVQSA